MAERFTVTSADTHKPLKPGHGESRDKTLAILGTKPGLVLTEWYVTAWDDEQVDAYGEPEVLWQMSAQEFVDCGGRFVP